VFEDLIIGEAVKKTCTCAFFACICAFSHIQLYKIQLALMKSLAHPKNLGNTKKIDMESINCQKM